MGNCKSNNESLNSTVRNSEANTNFMSTAGSNVNFIEKVLTDDKISNNQTGKELFENVIFLFFLYF